MDEYVVENNVKQLEEGEDEEDEALGLEAPGQVLLEVAVVLGLVPLVSEKTFPLKTNLFKVRVVSIVPNKEDAKQQGGVLQEVVDALLGLAILILLLNVKSLNVDLVFDQQKLQLQDYEN